MTESQEQLFQLKPDGNHKKFGNATVVFGYEADGKIQTLEGDICVRIRPDHERVEIHYHGCVQPFENPGYKFLLSQGHVDSLVLQATLGPKRAFLMKRPLLARECVFNNKD